MRLNTFGNSKIKRINVMVGDTLSVLIRCHRCDLQKSPSVPVAATALFARDTDCRDVRSKSQISDMTKIGDWRKSSSVPIADSNEIRLRLLLEIRLPQSAYKLNRLTIRRPKRIKSSPSALPREQIFANLGLRLCRWKRIFADLGRSLRYS